MQISANLFAIFLCLLRLCCLQSHSMESYAAIQISNSQQFYVFSQSKYCCDGSVLYFCLKYEQKCNICMRVAAKSFIRIMNVHSDANFKGCRYLFLLYWECGNGMSYFIASDYRLNAQIKCRGCTDLHTKRICDVVHRIDISLGT